jgi:hypothetical protein
MVIDHLIYRAPDLARAVADVEERLGVRAQAGGKHIGLGTHNALLALGPRTYLEILAPDRSQPQPAVPRPSGTDQPGPGRLAGWAITCPDIDAAVARARRRGYDPGEVADMQRATPAGAVLRWRLTLNATPGSLVPFLISWDDTEHPARSAPRGLILESFHLEHPDPASLAPALDALGADAEIWPAAAPALIAHLTGPKGSTVLR